MNESPRENSDDPQGPRGDRPVPAPQYGQYISGPGGGSGRSNPPESARYPQSPQQRGGRGARRGRGGDMPASWSIIGLCVAVWGLQWLVYVATPYNLASILGYAPVLTTSQPWRMLTSGFVHSMPSPVHLLLNMYTLYLFGRMLEPLLGTWRMVVLFVLSVLGGSLGVLLLGQPNVLVIGASGGVFGLFGAVFIFMRHFKRSITPIVVLIGINLAFGFLVGGIAWQAHVGGLIVGALVSLGMLPGLRKRR
ncbi:rhomboid family intramembrane serine protease [Kocuria sp. cx-455]|uniref:rhomboid family intramembrane serine protease n=1 Tax=Kocuria sp. cx-455 TaxID=2771377 RepID=UPI003D7113C6